MRLTRLRQPAGLGKLELAYSEPRRPGPGEVLMRVRASSLNFHDYSVVTGKLPTEDGRIPMSDGAGEIVEVGPPLPCSAAEPQLKAGDAVVSLFYRRWVHGPASADCLVDVPGDHVDGFASEYVTLPAFALTFAPKGYSAAEAATLPCAGLTAWRALMVDGPLLPGQTVLVQGTGGVSVFALQFAKIVGATVIATSSSDEKLARLKALGADHLINYRREPQWARRVVDITGGIGVDHVLEVGGPDTLPQSLEAVRVGGHVAMIGVLTGAQGPVSTLLLLRKNVRLQGLTVGNRCHQLDMVRAVDATGMRPIIDSHFPLESIADAFRHQEANRHFGKICLDI